METRWQASDRLLWQLFPELPTDVVTLPNKTEVMK